MKRKWLIGAALVGLLVLSGCAGNKAGSTNKGSETTSKGGVSMKILSGAYVVPNNDETVAKGYKYLALKLDVKNSGSKKVSVSTYDMVLRTKDKTKIKTTSFYGSDDDEAFAKLDSESLEKGDSTKGYVVFKVKTDTKYTLEYTTGYGDDAQKLTVPVDSGKYKDKTDEPVKAVQAFITSVYLNGKDLNYDKYVANNLDDEKKTFQAAVRKYLEEDVLSDTQLTDEAANKMITQVQEFNTKKGSAKVKIVSATPTKATVEVTPKVVDLSGLSSAISDLEMELARGSDMSYSDAEIAAKAAVVEKFPEVLEKLPMKSSDYSSKISLIKEKGKWKLDTEDRNYKSFAEPYTGKNY